MMGENWRPVFEPKIVHRELEIIKNDLHCNSVRICGVDIDRLKSAAVDALNQGLDIWFLPELWDRSPEETCDYVVQAAVAAEQIRQQWGERLVFSVGSELTLFMQGILKGKNIFERLGNPLTFTFNFLKIKLIGTYSKALNAFLTKTNKAVREVFHRKVAYAAVPLEAVDWGLFDFVSLDYYRGKVNRDSYGDWLKRYLTLGKPVVISEVGLCIYQGAEDKGGRGFMIVDPKNPKQLKRNYVRDEGLQAHELTDMLQVLDCAGVEGTFEFTFTSPNLPYNENPKNDLAMASYSLVKSYAGNKHGATYPEMTWEPKESFRAVADYYAKH